MNKEHESPPPFGIAPEGQDFAHPWIVSAIVSAIFFGIGFVMMRTTGVWANFWQWADGPFLFYFAILTPVLIGFYLYGICLLVNKVLKIGKK